MGPVVLLFAFLLQLGTPPVQAPNVVRSGGTATIYTIPHGASISTPTPTEEYRAEKLSPEEIASLTKAREALKDAEGRIRKAHGEYIREGYSLWTLECRSTLTEVEIWGDYALITVHHLNGAGCY